MLAVFDIDGTICDTQQVEGGCYARTFEEVFGVALDPSDWSRFDEPTSSGIVRSLMDGEPGLERREREFRDRFVDLLKMARPEFPGDFRPLPGAREFIRQLSEAPAHGVAFATGGFDTEAAFKLDCCGITLAHFPHATSSDRPRRRDIIPLAVDRAGGTLSEVIYFGDAPWDVEACAELGVAMIGIGRRVAELRALGLAHTFRDFSDPGAILEAIAELGGG